MKIWLTCDAQTSKSSILKQHFFCIIYKIKFWSNPSSSKQVLILFFFSAHINLQYCTKCKSLMSSAHCDLTLSMEVSTKTFNLTWQYSLTCHRHFKIWLFTKLSTWGIRSQEALFCTLLQLFAHGFTMFTFNMFGCWDFRNQSLYPCQNFLHISRSRS